MKGREFLAAARLCVAEAGEEWHRIAAGRAYYALFLEARDYLSRWSIGGMPSFQAHAFVRTRFELAAHADLKRIGVMIEELMKLRVRADYDIAHSFVSSFTVDQAIDKAESAIADLDAIDGDVARRAAAIAAIRAIP